jgi:uncharacterized Zn finger protein
MMQNNFSFSPSKGLCLKCRNGNYDQGGNMNSALEFEFVVGETYENEKGLFSVISISKEDMVIRWKNGEEVQTSIELQDRIQKRRQWEKTLQQEKPAQGKPVPKKAKTS